MCQKRLSAGRFLWWPTEGAAAALEAHQVQLLLYNGNPTLAEVAPVWRRVNVPV